MFDVGPSELLVIFVVALLVIGPERLPSAVKTASLWIGRFRRSFHKIKAEVERELNADEIRRQLHNESILAEVEDAKKQARDFAKDVEKSANLGDGVKPKIGQSGQTGQIANPDGEPGSNSAESQTTGSGELHSSDGSVKSEIRQAVSYVNDISREVQATGKEIEEGFKKTDTDNGNASEDKA
ncbi:MAG: twin-arginine translocase subunit TatB [Pseudomonadales bacterium]|nr:twin-arginine translocase subunit TatB [Pseudomonadales bacterium]MCP5347299.1 twin-arginine translocase subunit TatB [Pseudomonadales bacterium]